MAKRVIGICYGPVGETETGHIRSYAEKYGFEVKSLPSENFIGRIPEGWVDECEVIFGSLPPKFLKNAVNLKWLQTSSAGVAPYCEPGVLPEDVQLTNAAGSFGEGISEYMIALMLSLIKRFPEYMDNQREHIFRSRGKVLGVRGLKVTVLGLGDIGSEFAKRAHMLGAVVTGVKRTRSDKPDYIEKLYTTDEIDLAIKDADFVAMSLPGVRETENILNRERIFALKKGCYVINVGRGTSLDQTALVEALNSGHLAGAGLDVFEQEPIPENDPVWNAKNIIITPHVSGGLTFDTTIRNVIDTFVKNFTDYAEGKPFAKTVDKKLGY